MAYQIYALKYAERDTKQCTFFFREPSQDTLTLHFYLWVILGGPYPIVLDTPGPRDASVQLGNAQGLLPYSVLFDAQVTVV